MHISQKDGLQIFLYDLTSKIIMNIQFDSRKLQKLEIERQKVVQCTKTKLQKVYV